MRTYLFLILLFPISLFSQDLDEKLTPVVGFNKGWEGGLSIGSSFYQGDLHCTKDENLGRLDNGSFSFGLAVKKYLNSNFSLGLAINNSRIKGSDLDFSMKSGHIDRGLSFTNSLTEIGARLDYEPLGHKNNRLSPYIFVGLGVMFGEADVTRNRDLPAGIDDAVNQDMEKSATGISLPLGIGIKYNASEKISVGIEGNARLFTNDYLDGVSESASTEYKDFLGTLSLVIGYKF